MKEFFLTSGVNIALVLAYISFGVAFIGVIVFTLIQMFKDLNKAKKALIGIGIAVVVFVICFLFAQNYNLIATDGYILIKDRLVKAGIMRLSEAGIYMFYVLLVGAVAAIIYSSISRSFK